MKTDNNNSKNDDFKNKATESATIKSDTAANSADLSSLDGLSRYIKTQAGEREGRSIPPLDKWHPEHVSDMDMVIKANGEWWHEGSKINRAALVSLFASILWQEKNEQGNIEYYLKTPVQKMRITVEDAPLLINDLGIVQEAGENWLEFTTTTGDVVRLDDEHSIVMREYVNTHDSQDNVDDPDGQSPAGAPQMRPYMPVRNGLEALLGRNVFYHLIELGELTEQGGQTTLTLKSGGKAYALSVSTDMK